MSNLERPTARHRAGSLFGAMLVVVAAMVVLAPLAPVARALDPTPSPAEATAAVPSPSGDAASPTPSDSPSPLDSAPPPSQAAVPSDSPAPSDSPVPSTSLAPTDPASAPPSTAPSDSPPPATASPSPAAPLHVEHFWVSTLDQRGALAGRGSTDAPLTDAERFTVYLVRFQLVNVGADPVTVTPRIDATDAAGQWSAIPAVNPASGKPFYAAADDGRIYKARTATIAVAGFRLSSDSDPEGKPVEGILSAGRNPGAAITLPAHSFTELEFAVRATVDADWLTPYQLRLNDEAAAIAGGVVDVTMGAKPAVRLSPGAQPGAPAGDDRTAALRIGSVLTTSGARQLGAATPFAGFVSPHTNYTLTTDFCAACHADHTASARYLADVAGPSSNLCFQCHDGAGAVADVQAQYASPALPPNNPATSSYYSHPATAVDANHQSDRIDEFANTLNRHSVCADCHQPHNADASRPAETANGWTAPGTVMGASSVSVTNGAAGAAPSYQFKATTTLEYQLCFKCHSGYTNLPAQDPAHPSQWALDKAVEFNPANLSFHPVEAQGKNQSDAIKLSLSESAPGKRWSFSSTSTIRCTNCHGSPSSIAGTPTADTAIDTHASPNRGILLANYRDRALKASADLYDASDFSLCYLCHAEAPMVDDSGDARYDTNFSLHGLHLNDIWFKGGGGTSIDKPGDGQSNALCAECHFRTHGTALAANGQPPTTSLVNFAPDVTPYNGVLRIVPATPTTAGSCTLTCHGKAHSNFPYQYGYPVP